MGIQAKKGNKKYLSKSSLFSEVTNYRLLVYFNFSTISMSIKKFYNFYVNKKEYISFSGIARNAEAATWEILWKKLFLRFHNVHKKKTGLESLFNKFSGRQVYLKKIPTRFSCEYCEVFKNTNFEQHLRTAASGSGCFF